MHASVLKYFVEVARCGSVRKASERLFVAASAVNRQILKLEEELGCELFDRLPAGLRLNPAGERLLRHAQETLQQYQLVRTEIDALRGERSGEVRVAAMDSFFEELLPATLEEFLQVFPAATYSLAAVQPMAVPPMVLAGEADVGLCFLHRLPAGVDVVARARLPLGVVMPPGHPMAALDEVPLDECARYPFLRSGTQPVIDAALSPAFAVFWEAMTPAATCNSTPLLKRLIRAGRGVSCFSKIAFMQELARGELVWRPFALPAVNALQVGVLLPSQRSVPGVCRDFAERMARRLAQLERAANAL